MLACDVALPVRRKLRTRKLIKALARTEEFIAIKREMNEARKQVSPPT